MIMAILGATAGQAMWTVVSGSDYCQLVQNGACVTDGVGDHGNSETCVVAAASNLYATATEFFTETFFDHVTIGGTQYSGTTGPANVPMNMGDTFVWSSDSSVFYGGFTICGTMSPMALPPTILSPPPSPSPPPPVYAPAPPAAAGDMWVVIAGSDFCHVVQDAGRSCVTDGVGQHGGNEACIVRTTQILYATGVYFSTESFCACPPPHVKPVALLSLLTLATCVIR